MNLKTKAKKEIKTFKNFFAVPTCDRKIRN